MNVAVTGASGFIGRRLVDALNQQGHAIRILTRRAECPFPAEISVVGDLTLADCPCRKLVAGCDVVFHCAGELRNRSAMRLLHVDGTRRLLQAARREADERARPIHWVQLSSVGAYGPPEGKRQRERVVTEETLTRPSGEYEVTKTQSDEMVMQASTPGVISCSIVRPSNVMAADMPNGSLRSLGAVIRKGQFFYIGCHGAVATYVHVDDVVTVLRLCGSDDRAKGQIFNVSNDCLLEELVGQIARCMGVRRPWLRLPEPLVRMVAGCADRVMRSPLTQSRIDALVARTRYPHVKLERVLGFRPQISVPDAIGETLRECF